MNVLVLESTIWEVEGIRVIVRTTPDTIFTNQERWPNERLDDSEPVINFTQRMLDVLGTNDINFVIVDGKGLIHHHGNMTIGSLRASYNRCSQQASMNE